MHRPLKTHKQLSFYFFEAAPTHTCKQLLYFKIEYCLMITVPTHKHHKSPFKHSKTIYVFTSGRVIVTVEIHRRKKLLKGVKNDHCKMETGICRCGDGDTLRSVMPGEMLLFLYVLTFSSKESVSPFYSYMFPCYHLKKFIKCAEPLGCSWTLRRNHKYKNLP